MLKRNVRGGKPSDYPRWPFHGLRCAQLISSATVSGIMAYFMHFLREYYLADAGVGGESILTGFPDR
jgi:hypothetical protein